MKKKIFFALAFLFSSLCAGKPALVMGEKAKSYLNSRNQINFKHQNLKEKDVSLKKDACIVSIDESSHKTMDEMKKFFSKTYDVHEIKKQTFRIKKENVRFNLSEMDSQRALFAHQMLKHMMPADYVDKFMLVSVDTERSFSKSQGVKIEGYRFNFSRLFNNRVVRSKDDFLVIRTDAKGSLRDARFSLRDLKETSEIIKMNENITENEATLDSLLSEDMSIVKIVDEDGKEEYEKINKVEVGSVAEA
ncbi:hypothetical protein IKQ19_15970, partial [Candidatus Saccharibacteria bacterium]|nr:hypothetical protein [Candidatus Saccharibacteria bacterium]